MKTHRSKAALVITLAMLAAACAKKDEPAPARTEAAPAPAAAGTTQTSGALAAARPLRPVVTLEDQLENERAVRPDGTPHVEAVIAALEKSGLTVTDRQQHVATIYGAKYCLGAKSGEVAFSICEYETKEAALAGRSLSLKALGAVNRDIFVNQKTTMTVRQPAVKTAASETVAKKSVDAFARI